MNPTHGKQLLPALGLSTALLLGILQSTAIADDGYRILQDQCAACHALQKPEKEGLDHVWERGGPDLYYSGVKFRHEWLERWLQDPQRIRPGAELYSRYVISTPDGDRIDGDSLPEHPVLEQEDAKAVASALMRLKGPDGLVEEGAYADEQVSSARAQMFFGRLRGCAGCHAIDPGDGGRSGPNLGSAGSRLQPDFIYSYIKNPQAFDPHVWMPRQSLSERDLQMLTGYLLQQKSLEEDDEE